MVGIYAIRNKVNNKIYIGSSVNIERRFKRHRTELNCSTHCNEYLLKAYLKYGKDNFEFIIVEQCEIDNMLEREYYFISLYDSTNSQKGYNLMLPQIHPNTQQPERYRSILSKAKKGRKPQNFQIMQQKRWKSIDVFDRESGLLLHVFKSIAETESELGIKRGNVYNFLKNKTNCITTHPNVIFKYSKI